MISGIISSILLVLFVVGWAWVWSPRRRAEFERAARMPLHDDGPDAREDVP